MMQFVTGWFDFVESEEASCDWSENKVVDYGNHFHESLVNDHCVGKLEKENFDMDSEFDASDLNIDAWEISNSLPGEFDKRDTTIVKEEFKVESLFGVSLVSVLLHTCVQNLNGIELALDQWEQIMHFTRSKNLLLFFDHVSKNFVNGSWDVKTTNLRDMDLYSDWFMSKGHRFLGGSTTRSSYV
ncbi:hypothetical protein Ddye_004566 [Dipteronia dyeriana]|uniref:Aminotransferase class I/classII large domain-containing protein n=1 Tax=Dipteronia dyeriana TaxID=168575 RepID=A0AAD9XV59_9ROSI|nr:hypothetical protein Ddye_004566 [Dipteronia dyeriana]